MWFTWINLSLSLSLSPLLSLSLSPLSVAIHYTTHTHQDNVFNEESVSAIGVDYVGD